MKHKYYPPHILDGYNTVSFGDEIWFKHSNPPLTFSYCQPKEFDKQLEERREKDPYFDNLYSLRILGPKRVIKCLSEICPLIKDEDGKISNMYYKVRHFSTDSKRPIFGCLSGLCCILARSPTHLRVKNQSSSSQVDY